MQPRLTDGGALDEVQSNSLRVTLLELDQWLTHSTVPALAPVGLCLLLEQSTFPLHRLGPLDGLNRGRSEASKVSKARIIEVLARGR